MRFDGFTREDEQRFLDLTKGGVTAIFIYTDKVVCCGDRKTLGGNPAVDRTVVFGGEIYAPVSLFSEFLGASATECDGGVALEFGGKKACATYEKGGKLLPVVSICQSLGIYTRSLSENSFLLIGNEDAIAEIAADEVLVKAGPYALFGDYDASGFTDEDYEAVAKSFQNGIAETFKQG